MVVVQSNAGTVQILQVAAGESEQILALLLRLWEDATTDIRSSFCCAAHRYQGGSGWLGGGEESSPPSVLMQREKYTWPNGRLCRRVILVGLVWLCQIKTQGCLFNNKLIIARFMDRAEDKEGMNKRQQNMQRGKERGKKEKRRTRSIPHDRMIATAGS